MRLFDPYPTLRKVVLNLKTDRTFRGVLWQKRRGFVVLRSAELVKPGGALVAMDGELVVPADNIDFLQVIS